MDDGGKSVYNQTILHTRAFKLEDVKYIQSVLLENFSLITRPPSPPLIPPFSLCFPSLLQKGGAGGDTKGGRGTRRNLNDRI